MHLPHSVRVPLLRFIAFNCVFVFFYVFFVFIVLLLMYFTLINLAFMTTITILLPARMVYYLSYRLARLQRIPL